MPTRITRQRAVPRYVPYVDKRDIQAIRAGRPVVYPHQGEREKARRRGDAR